MRWGHLGQVDAARPVVTVVGVNGVIQGELEGGNVLQELVVLVDELDTDPEAVGGGNPRQQQPKVKPAVPLVGPEPRHWQPVHHTPPIRVSRRGNL